MRIKSEYTVKKIDGENIIVSTQGKSLNTSIKLTAITSFMFQALKSKNMSKEGLLSAVLDNFDISTVLALCDIDIFVRTLTENGIIEQ